MNPGPINTDPNAPSALAKMLDASEFLLLFENTERASDQSRRTRDGARAEPPPRAALSRQLAAVA